MVKKINNKILLILFASLLILTACNSNLSQDNIKTENFVIEDDFSNKIEIKEEVNRIVSLSPSTTEILFALGLGDKIVGVTSFCDYPEEALEIEKIGGYSDMDLEKIIDLDPDIAISSGSNAGEKTDELAKLGVKGASFNSNTIDEIFSEIERIGALTNNNEEAEELIKSLKERRDKVLDKVKDLDRRTVFYEVWGSPLQAAGKGSFIDELIRLSGGDNIASDSETPYPEYSIELLIDRNPEVYLAADNSENKIDEIKARPGFNNIRAIKDNNVILLDENIISRPGPRIVDALELVAEAIHGISF